MADLFFADLVREASWATGAGALALGGALPGHRGFAGAVPPGARFHYSIAGVTHVGEWETGEGEIAGSALVRTPIASSAGGAAVDFSAGLKTIALTVAATWFAARDGGVAEIDDVSGLTEALAAKAGAVHSHGLGDVAGLADALAGKAASSHGHGLADVVGLGAALDGKAPAAHGHDLDEVTGLPSALAGKAAVSHGHGLAEVAGLGAALDGKAAAAHGHGLADVTGLSSALDGKAALAHGHGIADVAGLGAALDGKAPASHGHALGDVAGLSAGLDAKAPLASPALTGTPTAPTAAVGANTVQIATTAFVRGEVAGLVGSAPAGLDTLSELAAAVGNDPGHAATVTSALAGKQPLDAELSAIAGLSPAADQAPYFTGSGTAALMTVTPAGRALIDDASAAAQRTTLGLGTAATQNIGASGANVPLLNAANTWGANQVVNGNLTAVSFFQSGQTFTITHALPQFIGTNTGWGASGSLSFGLTDVGGAGGNNIMMGAPTGKTFAWMIDGVLAAKLSAAALNLPVGVHQLGGTQVVAARRTGWTVPSGTATRTTFDTATVTTVQLAERVKALIDDLFAHGLIGI